MKSFKQYLTEFKKADVPYDYLVGVNITSPEEKVVLKPIESNMGDIRYVVWRHTDNGKWVKKDSPPYEVRSYSFWYEYYDLTPMTEKEFEEWFVLENI